MCISYVFSILYYSIACYTYIICVCIVTCTYGRLLDDRVSTKYHMCMLRTPDSGHFGSSLGFTNGRVNSIDV